MTAARLQLGPDLWLPAQEAQTQTFVVYGAKGMGKSNFCSVFAEELARCCLKFAWLDPVGVAWGLKHSADGRSAGVDVLILGGVHGDLAITPDAGAVVADFVVDEVVSVIIDISRKPDGRMWSVGDQIKFVAEYCTRLFERQGERRRPVMQIIDECGRFAPQMIPRDAVNLSFCKSALERLVEWGRNVGIGVLLTTQRSARMDKSVSELAEAMFGFRTVGPKSIDAIVDWFGEHVPRAKQHEYVEQIRQLVRGTAMLVSPGWLRREGVFEIRARYTFDSSDTPVAGKERKPSGHGTKMPDLSKYLARMSEIIEQAEAGDPRVLAKRTAELEREIVRLQKELKTKPMSTPVPDPVEVEVEVEVIPPAVFGLIDPLRDLAAVLSEIETSGRDGYKTIGDAIDQIEALRAQKPERTRSIQAPTRPARAAAPQQERRPVARSGSGPVDETLTKGERSVLAVLAQYPQGRNKSQLVLLSGYRWNGNFRNILSALRTKGYIDGGNMAVMAITSAGLDALGPYEPLPTGEALIEYWKTQLNKGEKAVFTELVDRYPQEFTGEALADRMPDYQWNGNFRNILSALRTRELIVGTNKDGVRAADLLMSS